ncbi:MAG TPA: pyridoxal phosphate-dependent aminotransferase [Candidatus Korarchaeota archaeon]|nr:pyridoxal phosphate-dependent aminotransferase [Candidatus Korarchaeota archaeon]
MLERLTIRDVMRACIRLKREGHRVIDAHIGAPSHDPPIPVAKALAELGEVGRDYAPFAGIDELREALSKFAKAYIGIDVEPERIFIASSGTHAVFVSILGFRGKHGLFPAPGFPIYFIQTDLLGIEYDTYNPIAEDLVSEILGKVREDTAFVVLNYPHNPTGYYPEKGVLTELYEELRDRGIYVIDDAVYHSIYYEERPEFVGDCVTDSFSKIFSVPGLRVGVVYLLEGDPVSLGRRVYGSAAGASVLSQLVCLKMLEALRPGYLEDLRSYYRVKRDILSEGLREAGFSFPNPKGAFYILAEHEKIRDSNELARKLLDPKREVCIGIVPAWSFMGKRNQFRISFGKLSEEDAGLLVHELEKLVSSQ